MKNVSNEKENLEKKFKMHYPIHFTLLTKLAVHNSYYLLSATGKNTLYIAQISSADVCYW